jgi:catechol 2,3-dioxygenase-like lactoylglutathione lyase family enzyme
MAQSLAAVTLLVRDYDEAIAFFCDALRFELLEDTPLAGGKRWVRVAPRGQAAGGTSLLLAQAAGTAQVACIGRQAGGRVALFLSTDDFDGDMAHMQAHGVRFLEAPRNEVYGRVVVFEDLHGQPWDLIQPAAARQP